MGVDYFIGFLSSLSLLTLAKLTLASFLCWHKKEHWEKPHTNPSHQQLSYMPFVYCRFTKDCVG